VGFNARATPSLLLSVADVASIGVIHSKIDVQRSKFGFPELKTFSILAERNGND
jgi:hypothetical protein